MCENEKEKNFISAVVYVRNNQDNIVNFLTTIDNYLNENFLTYEIICVNDNSDDKSTEKIKEFSKKYKGSVITILNMSYYQGAECSMQAGVDLAIGDFVYEFETTTISYAEEILRKVYDRCLNGYDIVAASPDNQNYKESNIFYSLYNNNISNTSYKLRTETFRIISRRSINRVASMSEYTIYRKSAYANCGLKADTIFYTKTQEIPKAAKKELTMQRETAINALILYTDAAYNFSMLFAVIMMSITVMAVLYVVYMYISGIAITGWTTIMLFLSFSLFAVISILTILIKYTSLILKIVFHKQKYIVESIEKLK